MKWDLEIGQEDSRTEIQKRHKGSESRGISAPGKKSGRRNIMLWWRPERGEVFGYNDGWTQDATGFYFSGTGQRGDQKFGAPYAENGRVRDHVSNGDHIRLLKYLGKNQVKYVGELRRDPDDSWHWIDGMDAQQRPRKMIQFRFLPVDQIDVPDEDRLRENVASAPRYEQPPAPLPDPSTTEVEALSSKQFKKLVVAREVLAQRTEAQLVHDFRDWLQRAHGVTGTGLRIPYHPERRNLRVDLWVREPRLLVEAKASTARESVRMAIGQLLDYARWLSPVPRTCLLTPDEPPQDMKDLLTSLSIAFAWKTPGGFEISSPDVLAG